MLPGAGRARTAAVRPCARRGFVCETSVEPTTRTFNLGTRVRCRISAPAPTGGAVDPGHRASKEKKKTRTALGPPAPREGRPPLQVSRGLLPPCLEVVTELGPCPVPGQAPRAARERGRDARHGPRAGEAGRPDLRVRRPRRHRAPPPRPAPRAPRPAPRPPPGAPGGSPPGVQPEEEERGGKHLPTRPTPPRGAGRRTPPPPRPIPKPTPARARERRRCRRPIAPPPPRSGATAPRASPVVPRTGGARERWNLTWAPALASRPGSS